MSRLDRLLYVRKQKNRERQTSFPPLERNPAWDKEDRERWSRYPLKHEYDPNYKTPEAATEQPGPPPEPAPEPSPVIAAAPAPVPDAPQPEPVPFTETFDALNKLIWNYLVCSEYQRIILALWIVHTYCFNILPFTPYLNIYSPEKQSGKTICLQLLRLLAHNTWMPGGGLTASRLMERIAQRCPTLLLDDWQTTFRPHETQAIIGFLNASSTDESQYTLRSAHSEDKDIFCSKAFAGSGSLPAPLADRSIPIVLQRRKRSEVPHPFCPKVVRDKAEPLLEQIRLWLADSNRDTLFGHANKLFYTDLLPRFSMRQRECALPLLAIAQMLGGKWPRKTRLALYRVFDIYAGDDLSTAVQLLADIRAFFAKGNYPQKIFTTELLEYLHGLKDRPWHRYHNGKPLDPNGLRKFLRDFGVPCSSSQRIGAKNTAGFRLRDFADLWERYLPMASANSSKPAEATPEVTTPISEVDTTAPEVNTNAQEVNTNRPEVNTKIAEVATNSEAFASIPNVLNEWVR